MTNTWGSAVRELQTLLELSGSTWRTQTRAQVRRTVSRVLGMVRPGDHVCPSEASAGPPPVEVVGELVKVGETRLALSPVELELAAQDARHPLPEDAPKRRCPGCGALVTMLETGLLIHNGGICAAFTLAAVDAGFTRYAPRYGDRLLPPAGAPVFGRASLPELGPARRELGPAARAELDVPSRTERS